MNFSSLLILVVMSTALLFRSCEARNPLCMPCIGTECNIDPDNCEHGVVRNFCGQRVCAKGPGDSCGGPNDVRGKCGEGMNCACSKCTGCSLATLECYTRHDHLIECLSNV